MPGTESAKSEAIGWSKENGGQIKPIGLSSIMGAVALIGAIAVGGWFYLGGGSAEKQHENVNMWWQPPTSVSLYCLGDAAEFAIEVVAVR